jgi:hypothetical protein
MIDNKIENFLYSKSSKEALFKGIEDITEKKEAEQYLQNAIADAEFTLNRIQPYLYKSIKILEVGGGLHLLSAYLYENEYHITSLEPGNFTFFIDNLRENIIKELNPKNTFTCKLEDFNTNAKYDFIFSINVLEHTDSVVEHIKLQTDLLRNSESKILVRAPNYNLPFDSHFYKFFIPFLPNFTFKKILKKKLIKDLGKQKYYDILNSLNFDCKFSVLNKNFKIKTYNPFIEIFQRLENDKVFNERILQNLFVKIIYKIISKFKVKIFNFIPKRLYPYLIIEIDKN